MQPSLEPWLVRALLLLVLASLAGCDVIFRLDDLRARPVDARPDVDSTADSTLIDGPPLDPRLVARFDFDGSFIDAKSGSSAACGVTACPAFRPGKHGLAIDLDGTNDCVRFSIPAVPMFTIAMWVNKATDGGQAIISKPVGSGGFNTYQVDVESSRTLRFITHDGQNFNYVTQAAAITLAQWQHVAVTFDGTKTMFVNGQMLVPTASSTALASDASELLIGCDNDFGAYGRFFLGLIDDVHVFDAALTPAEIATLSTL